MSSTTTTIPEHAADEAGGEAIYSSDGLPPLPSPPPPISQPNKKGENDDAVIEYNTNLTPTDAFEVFSGKLFISSNSNASKSKYQDETPLERLARLKAEVASLESDLSSKQQKKGSTGDNDGEEALRVMAQELATKLSTMNVRESVSKRQEDLTELVRLEMEKMSSSSKQQQEETSGGADDGKVVYELYGDKISSSSSSSSGLEERLRKVELLLGSSSSGEVNDDTVLKRLEAAENLAQRVDEKSLEKAAARAKVIRADLEAAAKARLKLSTLSPAEKNEDTKTISTLYDQLQNLENISHYLPTIVTRLQDLASLHTTSATFATRLNAVESMVVNSDKMMKDVEEALGKMEVGLEENVKVVQENVKVLDERMKALS